MKHVALVLAAATLSLAKAVAAQQSALAGRCYAFDQPYFTATGVFDGGPVVTWRTNVLRFRIVSSASDTLRHASQLAPLEPMSFRPDTIVDREYLERSGWRDAGRNNVIIEWYRAPSLRMAVRGDSLLGEVSEASRDRGARRLPPRRVSARQLDCASVPVMLMSHSDSVVAHRVAGCYELVPGAWHTDSELVKIAPVPPGPIRFELSGSPAARFVELSDVSNEHAVYFGAQSTPVDLWRAWERYSQASPMIVVYTPMMMGGLLLRLSSQAGGTNLTGVIEAVTDAVRPGEIDDVRDSVVARRVACH